MNQYESEWGMLFHADIFEGLDALEENSVDAVVTDPPYELSFMGQKWDGSGIAFQVRTWEEIGRVLKPGGHLVSFGGQRTYHRMACAVEDAGFEIRDSLMWLFGTGFPKSLNLGNGIGTALKPAYEPIILARKPIVEKTVKKNYEVWGTGGLNIEATRIGDERLPEQKAGQATLGTFVRHNMVTPEREGRWPANLAVECLCSTFEHDAACPARDLGAASRYFYNPKASRAERDEGLEHLVRVSGAEAVRRKAGTKGLANPRAGAGRSAKDVANNHPTVKPLELMRWLVRLVTPPDGIVLDPFCGSGSTCIAAALEERPFFGIDRDEKYIEIAHGRILHWEQKVA